MICNSYVMALAVQNEIDRRRGSSAVRETRDWDNQDIRWCSNATVEVEAILNMLGRQLSDKNCDILT